MILDGIRRSLKNIFTRKLRNFLTLIAIAIGVASVVLIATIGEMGKYTINSEIDSFGLGSVTIMANSNISGAALQEAQLSLIREQPYVDSAIPLMANLGKISTRGMISDCILWGMDTRADLVVSMEAVYGRLLNEEDVRSKAKNCVVDSALAEGFYKRKNIVGKEITLQINGRSESFRVVGVAASGGNLLQSMLGNIVPMFVYIPYTTLQELTGSTDFDQIAVKLNETVENDTASKKLVNLLSRSYGQENAFQSENIALQKERLNHILNVVTTVLSAIAGISLIVSGIGIMTAMLVSVNERTKEIGIKKAIGARNGDILFEFLTEAFTLSLFGSIIGIIIGLGLILIAGWLLSMPVRINGNMLLISVLFSILIGIIFSVYPAYTAAKMRPVDALRAE